ncbi:MAG: single-stranded DNA-binding protein [Firmicutes bacterium]|nr:single-stranded DNA-binding protein [Bacillota bacterium]
MQSLQINNSVVLVGKTSSELKLSHRVPGKNIYAFTLSVPRISGVLDKIIITAPQDIAICENYKISDTVSVTGQFRSYNNNSGVGNKLALSVFAKKIDSVKMMADDVEYINEIILFGYICREPIYRTTPFGREITDLLIAVNRAYNKSDYIPCIAWGKNAKYAKMLSIGDKVNIKGRIQSREYQKKINDSEFITKTAFEVSISNIT